MKLLMFSLALSLGTLANEAQAVETVTVDGTEYPLTILMGNCKSMSDAPEAMIACFSALSKLIEDNPSEGAKATVSVPKALEDLRAVAQYEDADTGLLITGGDCTINVVYFGNYYHLSRRNVSTLDLFSAEFDASKLQYDKITDVRGAQLPLSTAMMADGATAASRGGMGLESAQQNFDPKSARASMGDYAQQVVSQLPAREDQSFDFVLVHPKQINASDDIWTAFETYVDACKG